MSEPHRLSDAFDLIVFDMAGTTVQDRGEVPVAFEAALRVFGIVADPDQIARVRGASKRDALRALLGPDDDGLLEAIYAQFVETLAQTYQTCGVAAIEGAATTFAFFRQRGLSVALNTGFNRRITDLLLATLGWPKSAFAAVICGDDVAQGRPAPDLIHAVMKLTGVNDPRRVINVGDTVLDMEAGHSAGVGLNVGVLSGAHTRDQLLASPHTYLLPSVGGLPHLIAGFGAFLDRKTAHTLPGNA